jgi:hypothetical protein
VILKGLRSGLVLFLLGASIIVVATYFWNRSRPAALISQALATHIPKSATNVLAVGRTIPDSRVFELWATLDMSIDDAEQLAESAGAKRLPSGCTINPPPPRSPLENWQPTPLRNSEIVPTAWLRVSAELPDYLALQWIQGRLHLYYMGLPRLPAGTGEGERGAKRF